MPLLISCKTHSIIHFQWTQPSRPLDSWLLIHQRKASLELVASRLCMPDGSHSQLLPGPVLDQSLVIRLWSNVHSIKYFQLPRRLDLIKSAGLHSLTSYPSYSGKPTSYIGPNLCYSSHTTLLIVPSHLHPNPHHSWSHMFDLWKPALHCATVRVVASLERSRGQCELPSSSRSSLRVVMICFSSSSIIWMPIHCSMNWTMAMTWQNFLLSRSMSSMSRPANSCSYPTIRVCLIDTLNAQLEWNIVFREYSTTHRSSNHDRSVRLFICSDRSVSNGFDIFGDGNIAESISNFETQHACNKYCKWPAFGLKAFVKEVNDENDKEVNDNEVEVL